MSPLCNWALRAIAKRLTEHLILLACLVLTISWPAIDLNQLDHLRTLIEHWIAQSPSIVLVLDAPAKKNAAPVSDFEATPGVRDAVPIPSPDGVNEQAYAIDVPQRHEIEAIADEFRQKYGDGIRVETKDGARQRLIAIFRAADRSEWVKWTPVLLAILLLTLASGTLGSRDRHTYGLLRCLGWKASDVLKLTVLRWGIVFSCACLIAFAMIGLIQPDAIPDGLLIAFVAGLLHLMATLIPVLHDVRRDPGAPQPGGGA